MNRRQFLKAMSMTAAAVAVAPYVPVAFQPVSAAPMVGAPITFGGVPVIADQYIPRDMILMCSREVRDLYLALLEPVDRRYSATQ